MNWKALTLFGHIKTARNPPLGQLALGVIVLFGGIPWLLMDGEFLLRKYKYRIDERLLTVAENPQFFHALAVLAALFGLYFIVAGILGYKRNLKVLELNKKRQSDA